MKSEPREISFARESNRLGGCPPSSEFRWFEQSEVAIRVVEDGIRGEHPDADDGAIFRLLMERVDAMRRLEQPGNAP